MTSLAVVLLFICLPVMSACPVCRGPKKCNSNTEFDGFTDRHYESINNETIWGKCSYPNPQEQWQECMQPEASFLCDPDKLLSSDQAEDLRVTLTDAVEQTPCRCDEKCSDTYTGHPIVVLLAKHIRVPDKTRGNCLGPCDELYPQVDTTSREPSHQELDLAMDKFAEGILTSWSLGRCTDEIVIVYMSQYGRLKVSPGGIAKERLEDIFESEQSKALIGIREGDLHGALKNLVWQYSNSLRKNMVPFYIGVTIACILGVLIIFGIIMTIVFCHRELKSGKTCSQVCSSCAGGDRAYLFGGNKRSMGPVVYEATKKEPEPEV